ncbi:hypothetical protein [Bradyrhizobium retamae]|uniref:Uncharacterized protein n=1 Tax=Bradyrhizobium retamae TaxID=1300035 RepID=A0A0R3MW97_9BRAD|nr:hypothetical protein [Bradyrhizobium retamae]KRR22157.1 hypothetical protein CQ13_29960 [Bradyrhizobium retamae]
MQDFQEYIAAVSSYSAAALALCVDNQSTIIQVLGFILLVARLIKEVPAAVRVIKGWFGRV